MTREERELRELLGEHAEIGAKIEKMLNESADATVEAVQASRSAIAHLRRAMWKLKLR